MAIFQSLIAPLAKKAVSAIMNRREPSPAPTQTFKVGEGLSRTEALRAEQTVQARTAEGVQANQARVEKVADTVRKVANTEIPVPTGLIKEAAKETAINLLPSPFQTIARKIVPKGNIREITPMNTAEIATAPIRATAGSLVRTGARIGLQEHKAETGESITLVPRTMTEKLLLGKEDIRPFSEGPIASKVSSPFRALAKRAGASDKNAERFSALPLAGAALFVDNPFIGGVGKVWKEVAERGLKKIAPEAEKLAEAYVKRKVTEEAAARKGPVSTAVTKAGDLYREFKRKIIDSNAPIEDTLREAQKKGNFLVRPEFDINNNIARVYRSPAIAGQFAKDNGFIDVVKETAKDADAFEQYLKAERTLELAKQGRDEVTARDLAEDQNLVNVYGPKFKEQAEKVYAYSRKILDEAVNKYGLITKETAEKLITENPKYVPLERIFSEIEQVTGPSNIKSTASLSKQSVVRKLEGSGREIESPLESLLGKTYDLVTQGERNNAAKVLTSYADIPDNPFGLRLLKKDETLKAGESSISVLKNGIKEQWVVDKEIAEAAKNMNVQQLDTLQKIFAFPVRLGKAGITGFNLAFGGSNIVRDQQLALITSKFPASTANPANFVRGLFSAVKKDDLYDEVVNAAAGGTSFDVARNQVKDTVESLRAGTSAGAKAKYIVSHPVKSASDLLRTFENFIGKAEEATRIQQYKGTKDALLKEGRTAKDAELLAARAARENTADFYRRGEWGPMLNSMVMYLNASIQGSRSFIRAMEANPGKTSAKVAATLLFPMAATTAWNLSDPTRKQAYEDVQEYEREGNFIIVPPNPTKDEQGRWDVIKIPMPPGISKLTIPVRRALESAHDLDPLRAGEVFAALSGVALPFNVVESTSEGMKLDTSSILSAVTPQFAKPSIESYTNKNLFTGSPIVSQKYEKLSPELQVKPETSGTARIVGKFLGKSPIKVEEFIRATGGGAATQILNGIDRVLAGLDIIPKDQVGGQSLVDAITSRFTKARGGKQEQESGDAIRKILQDQADERFVTSQEAEIVWAELKELSPEQKGEKLIQLNEKNPEMISKLKTIALDEKKGLSSDDRLVKQLGVENGKRAKFIAETLNSFESGSEKAVYLQDLKEKGLLSKEVIKQLTGLLSLKPQEQ